MARPRRGTAGAAHEACSRRSRARARLGDLHVRVPAAAAERAVGREPESPAAVAHPFEHATPVSAFSRSDGRGRAPSSVCGARAGRGPPPRGARSIQTTSSSPNARSAGRMSAATAKPLGRASCNAPNRAHTASSSGRSTWQETTAYRSRLTVRRLYRHPYVVLAVAAGLPATRRAALRARVRSSPRTPTRATTSRSSSSSSGTYGFIPGIPSAYTQPLYGFFLIPIYWVERSWVTVGAAHIAVAIVTAWLVYAIGTRIAPRRSRDRGRATRDAASVPRLARHSPEPRDPRRAPCGGARSRRADRCRTRALALVGGGAWEPSSDWRSSATRGLLCFRSCSASGS